MGVGISGIIPLAIYNIENKDKYFNKGFFENYEEHNENKDIFIIKEDILLKNYSDFLYEFYDIIEMEISKDGTFQTFDVSPEEESLEGIESLEDFEKKFSMGERDVFGPFTNGDPLSFSTLGCYSLKYFVFYSGSYKVIFEEYSTFTHFEKVLSKLMKNPLAKSIKIGLFG